MNKHVFVRATKQYGHVRGVCPVIATLFRRKAATTCSRRAANAPDVVLVRDARGVPCGGKRRLLLVHTTDTAKAQSVKRDHWYGTASTLGACSWMGYGRWSGCKPAWRVPTWSWFTRVTSVPEARIVMNGFRAW